MQMGLWKELQEVKGQVGEVTAQSHEANLRLARQVAQQQLDTALSQFKAQYPNITDEEITSIRPIAGQLLPAIQQNTPDPVAAMKRALFVAAVENPTVGAKIVSPNTSQQQTSADRKKKLSSLGGSSGSAGRSPRRSAPSTDKDAVSELASAIEEAYSSNGRLN